MENLKLYNLGAMDLYPLSVYNTSIEDSPTIVVVLDEEIDEKRLYDSLLKALEMFPLFKTKIVFKKGFKLEENTNEVKIFNINDLNKAFTWKKGTNDYPWKLSFYDKTILLRWCHAITDGRGARDFLGAILNIYYGVPYSIEENLELGLEPFCDKNEKGLKEKKQEKGFAKKGIKTNGTNDRTKCHILKCNTADVLKLSKRNDASPATIIPPLFSMALRASMKEKLNVKFSIVIDARGPLESKTMHNCIITKDITYIDKFDNMDFELVSTIYRAILNLALEKENVIKNVTEFVSLVGPMVKLKSKSLVRFFGKVCSIFLKVSESDATFSYIGEIDYGTKVNEHVKDIIFRSWTDFGYLNIVATDLNGIFTMNVTHAYENSDVVNKFIDIAKEQGLEITEVDSYDCYKEKN